MGLDMYLTKRTYLGLNHEHNRKDGIPLSIAGDEYAHIRPERVREIIEEVGYWRKANAIHGWLVKNVQDGVDDCKDYYVDEAKLRELLDAVNRVLTSTKLVPGTVNTGYSVVPNGAGGIIRTDHTEVGQILQDSTVAETLLPTTSGFFFGGGDYDQYYWDDLVHTKRILENVLENETQGNIYYHSSW